MRASSDTSGFPLLPITTLAAWLTCLAAGLLGLLIPYPQPQPPIEPQLPPTQLVNVQVPPPQPAPPPQQPTPLPSADLAPSLEPPPPNAPPPPNLPVPPAVTPVALATPSLAFALPTEGLTHIVDVPQASFTRNAAPSRAPADTPAPPAPAPPPPPPKPAPPAPQRLTLGQGEGRQPPPAYPREAALAGQQGTVTLRLSVDATGHITSVDILSPSRWPLLNQAATRAIRDTWHFPPGPPRLYDVPIEFQLNQ